jgi:hypothetical protein
MTYYISGLFPSINRCKSTARVSLPKKCTVHLVNFSGSSLEQADTSSQAISLLILQKIISGIMFVSSKLVLTRTEEFLQKADTPVLLRENRPPTCCLTIIYLSNFKTITPGGPDVSHYTNNVGKTG